MVDDNDVVFAQLVQAPDNGAANQARASGNDQHDVLLSSASRKAVRLSVLATIYLLEGLRRRVSLSLSSATLSLVSRHTRRGQNKDF